MDFALLVVTAVSLGLSAVFGATAIRLAREERRRSEARVAALAGAIDGAPAMPLHPSTAAAAGAPPLLFETGHPAPHAHPVLKLAIGVVAAIAVIIVLAMAVGGEDPASPEARPTGTPQESLELLSMRHARDGDRLTVTGLVRNPGDADARGITAVVFAFDRGGSFVASGRAPLEFARLTAGDESPFVVTVPNVAEVGRYRVSFRTEDGVVRHVDRR